MLLLSKIIPKKKEKEGVDPEMENETRDLIFCFLLSTLKKLKRVQVRGDNYMIRTVTTRSTTIVIVNFKKSVKPLQLSSGNF